LEPGQDICFVSVNGWSEAIEERSDVDCIHFMQPCASCR